MMCILKDLFHFKYIGVLSSHVYHVHTAPELAKRGRQTLKAGVTDGFQWVLGTESPSSLEKQHVFLTAEQPHLSTSQMVHVLSL